MTDTFVLGAVAYDPKVVTIWDGFREWFAERDFDFDYQLFSNYERQVEQHFAGGMHAAWNSPLAWLQTERVARARGLSARAIAMRDTDMDLTSVIVAQPERGIARVEDLRGCTVGVGAADSPQATLIPLLHLARAGLEPGRDFTVRRFDVLLGKHGDHVGGELEAARALLRGEVDACCMIDGNLLAFGRSGALPPGSTRVIAQTAGYDHCNFTVLGDAAEPLVARFTELLLSMSYDDPRTRPLMDLEGLKAWREGRTCGYAMLAEACERFDALREFLDRMQVA